MADRVQNAAVFIHQNEVAVLAHHLQNDPAAAGISQFIQYLKLQLHDAVKVLLLQGKKLAASEIFAEQHAEHGRRQRRLRLLIRQLQPGSPGVCAQQQPLHPAKAAETYHDFLRLGLVYFIDTAAQQRPAQLAADGIDDGSVKGHGNPPFSEKPLPMTAPEPTAPAASERASVLASWLV